MAVPGGDDDATPEVAFKNVPRRRRSAASSGPAPAPRPPKEEDPPGGDDEPGRGGGSSAQPPPPPLPSRDVRRAEKRRRLLLAEDAKNGGGGGAPPVPSRTTDEAAAASRSRELLPADWAEKERIRKGKMPAASVDASRPAGSGRGKLMGDAIRCHGTGSKKKPPKSKKRKGLGLGPPFWYGMGRDGQSTSTAGSGVDHSFSNLPPAVVTPGLRAALAGAGTNADAPPVRVYGRLMSGCDRNTHQSRLQMSCKSWRAREDGEYPVCAFLNAAEKAEAHGEGLLLEAYDRRGEDYDLKLRYLRCNSSYRLISKWGHLLRSNGLVVDKGGGGEAEPVMLELWLFRPPGGTVGMVVLHYYKGDAKHADAALEEEEDRRRAKRRRLELDDAYCYSAAAKASHRPPESNAASMDGGADGTDGKVKGDASATASPAEEPAGGGAKAAAEQQQAGGAKSAAAAALAPDADGTKVKEKEAGGALVDASAPSSSDAVGGAAKVVEEEGGAASGEADHGTMAAEEKDASAAPVDASAPSSSDAVGGAAKVVEEEGGAAPGEADHGTMAAEEKDASAAPVEAAGAQSASPSDAGGAASKEAAAPSDAGGAASKEAAPPPPPPGDDDGGAKKAASGFGLTSYEWFAALALVQLSRS